MNDGIDASGQKDFFDEIKERERKRFSRAIKLARGVILKNHFPSLQDRTIEEIREYEWMLNCSEVLLSFSINRFFKHLPSPCQELRGRSVWEVYLSGMRHLTRRYPNSYFRKLLNLKEWEDAPNTVDAYAEKCLRGTSDFLDLARETREYVLCYNQAREIVRQYMPEEDEEGLQNLCRLYASLKNWRTNEEFDVFQKTLEASQTQVFEIIIEGPIHLYLFIGKEHWILILKVLTVEKLSDFLFMKEEKEIEDLKDLHEFVFGMIENSQSHKCLKELAKEVLKIYLEDYLKEVKLLRKQYPTEDLRRKFVRRFESGEIFKQED